MSKFISYPFYHDDVPIDISFIFKNECPAGKHGFLKTKGRDLVFEDGTKATFWGTNFNGAGCFPEHDYAEVLAARLEKIGINLVRFHQLDSEWHTPNLFAFTKGKRFNCSSFDEKSLDRLDYLIYCLKKHGIYCYMDMFTYRKFKSEEGVENAAGLPDAAKPYCIYSEHLIELQKDLCKRLWTHVNPYTELSYADDPVFVLAEIVNESDLFSKFNKITVEPYKTDFLQKFDAWLKEKNIDKSAADFDLEDYDNETLIDFKIDLQEKYYKTMVKCMRDCGVKIPINGSNWTTSPAHLKTQRVTDFYDSHPYLYDWCWGEYEWRCPNHIISGERDSYLALTALSTAADMPTFVSEWDAPWPSEFRAESAIYNAAVGMFQGWSGFAIHTYSYSTKLERMNMLGRELSATKVGNVPYRNGMFSAWNDPAKFGLFYHAALITRRGDVSPAKNTLTLKHTNKAKYDIEPANINLEKSAIVYDTSEFTATEPVVKDEKACDVMSDTKELYRNWEKNYGYVNTPKTKCAYGFLCKNGKLNLDGVNIDCKTDFATIALSSLSDEDICSSDNILLTAVGRAHNTDSKFEGELMLDIGKPPVLIEVIEADIEIETNVEGLKVWAISAEGYYIGTAPAVYEDNKLKFTIGTDTRTMYYLIVKE